MSLPPNSNKEKIPKDYFSKMNHDLFNKLENEEQFEISDYPLLNSIDKNKDFTIPKNYFLEFEVPSLNKSKLRPLTQLISKVAIGVIIIGVGVLFKVDEPLIEPILNQGITEVDFLNDPTMFDVDEIDLINLMAYTEDEIILDGINNEELIEYLIQESELEDLNNLQ